MSAPEEQQAGTSPRLVFLFALVSALTVTLGLVAAGFSGTTIGEALGASGSDRDLGRARLAVLGVGLLGLGLTVLLAFLGRRSSRPSLVGLVVIGLAMAVSATLVATLLPSPGPVRPVGPRPWALLGVAVGLLAWAGALATNRWRHADPGLAETRLSWPWRALAGLIALALAIGVGIAVDVAGTAYRTEANSYTEVKDRTAAQPAVTSRLDGTVAWRVAGTLPDADSVFARPVSSFGLVLGTDSDVVSVDRVTGAERWRYFRSDLDDYSPQPVSIDQGRRVLVDWTSEHAGYVVLDADTGRRLAGWPSTYADDDLEVVLDDGALLSHEVAKGSDSIVRVDLDGDERWRFAPGRCKDLVADATAAIAVITVHDSCAEPRQQMIGLDLASGRQLWAMSTTASPLLMIGETLIAARSDRDDVGTLLAIDTRTGRQLWTRDLQPVAGNSCSARYVNAGSDSLQAVCLGDDGQHATVLRISPTSGAVRRLELGSRWLEDVALTQDGRTVVLAREAENEFSAHRMLVSDGGAWRAVALPRTDDPSGFNVFAAGDQVLLSQHRMIYALN